jgi:ABC transport system ATP-binding/permease protein
MTTLKGDRTMSGIVPATRRQRDLRPHMFERLEGPGAPERITLERMEYIIGRTEDADIRVDSQRASRHHAILTRDASEYTIRDNQSRNGIFLNGVKVHSAVLRDGDIVQVAECVFAYHEG